jgi:hypothetical protein
MFFFLAVKIHYLCSKVNKNVSGIVDQCLTRAENGFEEADGTIAENVGLKFLYIINKSKIQIQKRNDHF